MWFNSMQREEPYLLLTSREASGDAGVPSGTLRQVLHGCRQLRVVKCWVKSRNERNPYPCLPASNVELQGDCAVVNRPEEGGDGVKSSWPYSRATRATMAHTGQQASDSERIPKSAS